MPGRGGEAILVGWTDATTASASPAPTPSRSASRPDATAARDALVAETATLLALESTPLERIAGRRRARARPVFGLFDALALVAVIVAALGIVNTLTMNVLERVREIGVLRAAGMTRGQVWRSVVVEAGILGLAGAVARRRRRARRRRPDGRPRRWPLRCRACGSRGRSIGLALVLGVGLSRCSPPAYPARLASRLSIVRAVQYE